MRWTVARPPTRHSTAQAPRHHHPSAAQPGGVPAPPAPSCPGQIPHAPSDHRGPLAFPCPCARVGKGRRSPPARRSARSGAHRINKDDRDATQRDPGREGWRRVVDWEACARALPPSARAWRRGAPRTEPRDPPLNPHRRAPPHATRRRTCGWGRGPSDVRPPQRAAGVGSGAGSPAPDRARRHP